MIDKFKVYFDWGDIAVSVRREKREVEGTSRKAQLWYLNCVFLDVNDNLHNISRTFAAWDGDPDWARVMGLVEEVYNEAWGMAEEERLLAPSMLTICNDGSLTLRSDGADIEFHPESTRPHESYEDVFTEVFSPGRSPKDQPTK